MQSKRLLYRIISEEDAEFLLSLMKSPKWKRFVGDRNLKNVEDAKEYIASKMSADLIEKGFVNYIMLDKILKVAVGTCSIHDREGVDGLDIGYALLAEYEGLGYATEGASKMLEVAFKNYHAKQISAITTIDNRASGRLLEKIGFQQQDYIQLPNAKEKLRLFVFKKEK